MHVLERPFNLFELLRQDEGLLDSVDQTRYDLENLYLKRIATLSELTGYRGSPTEHEQEFSLAFATSVGTELSKLKHTVLFAPLNLGGDGELSAMPCESNIVLRVENPRLGFIKLASQIFKAFNSNSPVDDSSVNSVTYGENCIVKEGAVIGSAGFGFERDADGTPIRFPHFGRVLIGNNVEIGANSVISRGAIEDTVIGDSTKIDDLVYVAHNCKVGKGVMIAGNATLCGGVQIEDEAWIGAGASIKQNLQIGKGATVGMGAVVTRDVPAYSTVAGNPAREIGPEKQAQGAV